MGDSYYDTAQICLNGHVINGSFHDYPEHNQDHCDKCGKATITKCQKCNAEIRGDYKSIDVGAVCGDITAPNFCHKCGTPYPWMTKKMEAFREITDNLEEITSEEKEKLKSSIDDIVVETPNSEVAGLGFKKILKKLKKDSYECIRGIIVDIASEAIKKSLFGN